MSSIAVVMPHLPLANREPYFIEAKQSIADQTRPPDQIVIEADPDRTGCAATLNRGLKRVTCDWVAQLGDDDRFLPEHLETLAPHLTPDVDVVYPLCIEEGASHGVSGPFDAERIQRANYIPGGGSIIRTSLARLVGGWAVPSDPDWHQHEDWVMWKRLLAAGAVFRHVPQATWVYRFWPGQTGGL